MKPEDIKKKVDAATKALLTEEGRRGYLGASGLGAKCMRQVWYTFRWAYQEQHQGRLLRLFNRGHEEEHRVVRWLRAAGAEVRDYDQRLCLDPMLDDCPYVLLDWDTPVPPTWEDVSASQHHISIAAEEYLVAPSQWGFKDHDKHFAGHSDGKVSWPGVLPDGWGLFENKTANDKSFKQIVAKGVISTKPIHWTQMQIYMHYLGLKWALYVVVNKNDDDMHYEIVHYRPEIAAQLVDIAAKLIQARTAPPKYSTDPSWWECKFCVFREICHYQDTPQKNCRSCQYAMPGPEGSWVCTRFGQDIPTDFIPLGCNDWSPIE